MLQQTCSGTEKSTGKKVIKKGAQEKMGAGAKGLHVSTFGRVEAWSQMEREWRTDTMRANASTRITSCPSPSLCVMEQA